MPALSRLAELHIALDRLNSQIDQFEELLTRIDHLRAVCPRGSPRDIYLWSVYRRIDDHIVNLQIQWQNITDEIENLPHA